MTVTLVVDGAAHALPGEVVGADLVVDPTALADATGWHLRAEGLCRGDVCIPRFALDGLERDAGLDLVVFARALGRPLAVEPAAAMAVLAESPDDQAAAIAGGQAPPFVLPDLDGNPVALADFTGRKKLLLAWSSW